MSAGLNTSPTFIRALGEMVLETLGHEQREVQVMQADDFTVGLTAVQ
jgi:hypothetical protein